VFVNQISECSSLGIIVVFNELCCGVCVYGTGLFHWCCLVHEFTKWVLFNTVISYVIFSHVIFYCANTPACHVPDWKFSEGGRWLNWVANWVAAWRRLKTTTSRSRQTPTFDPNTLLVVYYCIRHDCTFYGARARPAPPCASVLQWRSTVFTQSRDCFFPNLHNLVLRHNHSICAYRNS